MNDLGCAIAILCILAFEVNQAPPLQLLSWHTMFQKKPKIPRQNIYKLMLIVVFCVFTHCIVYHFEVSLGELVLVWNVWL